MPHAPDKPYDLFVSYAGADRAWVEGFLLNGLRAAGVRFLTPTGYELGADWGSEFERAVRQSRRVLLVLSGAYLADIKQLEQAGLAYFRELETESVLVIPLLLDEVEVPLRLRQKVSLRAVNGEEQDEALHHLARVCEAGPPADGKQPACPYPGMEAYDRGRADQFHGRRREVEELLQELRYRNCLFLIGGSGSGKSSLVFAGLLPRLEQGRTVHVMRPGPTPAARLAALTGEVAGPCLLVVDQFEEVYTRAASEESRRFQEALAAWAAEPGHLLVATVRADFFLDLQNSPAIFPLFRDNRRDVLRLDRAGLREAIERPAAGAGVFVEPALVERLLADAADELCVLPHLQATLQLLWDRRRRRYLPLEAYLTLGRDGRTGLQLALALEADRAVRGFKEEELAVARRTLLRLVQFGEGREDTRRQQPHAALENAGEPEDVLGRVLARLILHRLVVPDEVRLGAGTVKVYDLAREALIAGWPRLQEWVRQYRAAEQTRRRLEGRADEWVRLGRGAGGLLAEEVELREAEDWLAQYGAEMGARAELRELVRASRAKLEGDRTAARRRVRRTLVGLTAALLVVSALAVWGGINSYNAYREAHVANAQLTEKAIDEGDMSNARKLLRLQRPGWLPFQSDLRGFEWYYWWRLCHRERHTLKGHNYVVRGVVFAADHTLISATGEWNRQRVQVKRWRVTPGEEQELSAPLGKIVLHGDFVDALAVSPDGRWLAYGTAQAEQTEKNQKEFRVTLRALDSDQSVEELVGAFPKRVACLAFSPDGRRLAAADRDGDDVWVWETAAPRRECCRVPVLGPVHALALNRRGWLAIAHDRQRLTLVEAATGRPLPPPVQPAADAEFACLAFGHADDRLLAAGTTAGVIQLWDLRAAKLRGSLSDPASTRRVTCLAFAPNGTYLAAGGDDHKVRLWDPTTGTLHDTFPGHNGPLTALAFSADGKTLASGGMDHAVRLWDVPGDGRLETPWPRRPNWTVKIVSSPDGHRLVTGDFGNQARLWDVATARETRAFKHDQLAVALSPDGDLLATGGVGAIRLWDVATGKQLQEVEFQTSEGKPERVSALAFGGDGTLAAGDMHGTVRLFRLQDRALSAGGGPEKWHARGIYHLAFSPRDGELASASNDGTVLLWGKGLSPRLRILVSEKAVRLGDALTPTVKLDPGSSREVWSFAFAPDGHTLATACGDGLVRVWDARTGDMRDEFGGHVGAVYDVAYSPDGSTLASGGADATVRLWNLRTRRPHATLRGHGNEPVRAVAFAAPEGKRHGQSRLLVSASRGPTGDGILRFWRAATEQEVLNRGD
jgi:WD40 repeat protein